jgi:methionine biosynthesis protein MetW
MIKMDILIKLRDYTKKRVVGTQYELESHIDNIFCIFDKNLKTYTPKNMLDVGCNDGDRTIQIAEHFNIHAQNIFGLDYNDAYIVACEERFNVKKIDLETEGIPWEDNTFDIVICNQVLEHLKNYKKVIDDLIRVTKKNGYIVIGIPNLAHLINRILLLFGIQPMCIHLNGPHVRGFTYRDFRKILVSIENVKLVDCTEALIYPLPYFMTRHIDDYFVGLCGYVCYLLKKTQ